MINSSKKARESLYLSDKRESISQDSRYSEITVINQMLHLRFTGEKVNQNQNSFFKSMVEIL